MFTVYRPKLNHKWPGEPFQLPSNRLPQCRKCHPAGPNGRHPATLSQQKQEVQTEKPLEHSQHPPKTKEREQNSKTGEMKGELYLNHFQNSDCIIVFFVIQRMLGRHDLCYTALMQILWVASGCWNMLIHDHYHLVCCGQLAGSPLHTNWWIKWGTEPLPHLQEYTLCNPPRNVKMMHGIFPWKNRHLVTGTHLHQSTLAPHLGIIYAAWGCCPAASIKMDKVFTAWDL